LVLLGGCAANPPATQPASSAVAPSPAPQLDSKSLLTLDQILPAPKLATTRPVDRIAPADALVLYARGVENLLNKHPTEAINAFQAALKADPDSYQLNIELGRALLDRPGEPREHAFAAFERACAIRPDDLKIHLLLGKTYLIDGKLDQSISHLRLAMQTPG